MTLSLDARISKLLMLSSVQSRIYESLDHVDIDEAKRVQEELTAQLKSKLQSKSEFTVFHALEPNGRLSVAHAARYLWASRIVNECGGRYLVFVDDVGASQNISLGRDKAMIDSAATYAMDILTKLGVRCEFLKSSDFAPSNNEVFVKMLENSMKIPVKDVKNMLPPAGKQGLMVSTMMAPCLQCTEILALKADIVLIPACYEKQMSFLSIFDPENAPVVIPMPNILNLKTVGPTKGRPDPRNVFFFEDNEQTINKKAAGAFCNDSIKENPIYEYICFIVAPLREEEDDVFKSPEDFAAAFPSLEKKVLKQYLAQNISKLVACAKVESTAKDIEKMASTVQ